MDSILKFFLKAFMIIFISIPASSLITVKFFLFFITVYVFAIWILLRRNIVFDKFFLIGWLILSFIFITSFLQTVIYGDYISTGVRFVLNVFAILILIFIYYISIKNNIIILSDINNSILASAIVYSILKIIILLAIFMGYAGEIKHFIKDIIYKDYYAFKRLNLGNDSVILFSLLLTLPFRKSLSLYLVLVIILFILTTSFTKYLLISTIISLLAFAVSYKRSIKTAFVVLLFIFVFLANPHIFDIYIQRFIEYSSYEDKFYQVKLFLSFVLSSMPVFLIGTGAGSYIDWFIKNPRLPFVYEVQWLSLIYQLGILRICIVIFLLILSFYKLYKVNKYISFVFSLWIFASFTNPYLLITVSFVIYIICIAILLSLREK